MRKPVMLVASAVIGAAVMLVWSPLVRAQQTDTVIRQGSATGPSSAPAPVSPAKTDDSVGSAAANDAAAAAVEAQTRKIIRDKQEYKASVDKSIADYDAKMEEYRRQVRENEARNAEIRRRNDARMALYKACVAGDKAACVTYNSGQ